MEWGEWEDVIAMENVFPREDLLTALDCATAATLSVKSWTFWHLRLEVCNWQNIPPLPLATAGRSLGKGRAVSLHHGGT